MNFRGAAPPLLATMAVVGVAGDLRAEPQISAGLRSGLAGESRNDRAWEYTNLYVAVRGDVLLGRESNGDIGLGPFLQVGSSGFQDGRISGGASVLLPVHPDFPFVVSAGGYAKSATPQWGGGMVTELFWGLRSYNYHSVYGWSVGVFADLQYDLVGTSEHTFIVGAHVDATIAALPFVILVNWFRDP